MHKSKAEEDRSGECAIIYPEHLSVFARMMRALRRHYTKLVKRGIWTIGGLAILFAAFAVAIYGGYIEVQNNLAFEAQLRAEEGHMEALQEQLARHAEEKFIPLQVTLNALRMELMSLRLRTDEYDGGPQMPAHAHKRLHALHKSLVVLQERFDFLLEENREDVKALQEQFDVLEERFNVLSEDYSYEHSLGDYYEQQLGLTVAMGDPLTLDRHSEVCRLSLASNNVCP